MCTFSIKYSKMATTIGDMSYCPIVSLLTRYAGFSSCHFTPSMRTHLFSNQEYVFEVIMDYLAHVLFPPRQRKKTNTLTASEIDQEEEEGREGEEEQQEERLSISHQTAMVVLQQPVYMYIDMSLLGDETEIKKRKIKNKIILSNATSENYQQIQKKEVMHNNEEDEELEQNCTNLDDAASDNMKSKQIIDLQSAGNDMRKVRFNLEPEVHVMCTWSFAYQAARKGDWHFYAVDRSRFQMRCQRASLYLNPILTPEHRNKIYMSRFAE